MISPFYRGIQFHSRKVTMTIQTISPTLDTLELSKLLKCSDRHIANLDKAGKLPAPVHLGNLKRWVRSDIDLWLSKGCPDRKAFASLKAKA